MTLESGTKLEKFKKIRSIITPFDKANVDTDQIVPKQFLKLIHKVGFGKYLFTTGDLKMTEVQKKISF